MPKTSSYRFESEPSLFNKYTMTLFAMIIWKIIIYFRLCRIFVASQDERGNASEYCNKKFVS